MNISTKGIDLIKYYEGVRNKPYLCAANIWTIGVGSVLYQEQIRLPMVRKEGYAGLIRNEFPLKQEHNRVWSKEEIDSLFRHDLTSFERGVLRLAPNLAGRQGSFDACVAFSFNVGLGNFQRSTIRMKIGREDWDGAAEAFMSWTKAGGKELRGLVLRRTAERKLFESSNEKED
jgi:lysozyme